MEQLKIKVLGLFYVNKKQYFVIYGTAFSIAAFFSIFFIYVEVPLSDNAGKFTRLITNNFSLFWFIILLSILLEAQFYWLKFVQKQLKIIKKQKDEIQKKNEELNQQKEEILAQRDEIEQQRDEIEQQRDYMEVQKNKILRKNKEITDSINYAQRIQSAILPPNDQINTCLSEYFIYFKPRDIVSGDFYWMSQIENQVIIAAADCTGHGIPGAFMSMMGVAFLNEAMKNTIGHNNKSLKASDLLEFLRNEIKNSLHQNKTNSKAKDGMDIALCIIDKEQNQLQFAGANNPLYIVTSRPKADVEKIEKVKITQKNGTILYDIKATRNPIGVYIKEKPFENHVIQIAESDRFYLFSDGLPDQIGGEHSEKFKYKRFKDFFMRNYHASFPEQHQLLETAHTQWQGENSQIDDIIVIGFGV